jgi:hypothetical protein
MRLLGCSCSSVCEGVSRSLCCNQLTVRSWECMDQTGPLDGRVPCVGRPCACHSSLPPPHPWSDQIPVPFVMNNLPVKCYGVVQCFQVLGENALAALRDVDLLSTILGYTEHEFCSCFDACCCWSQQVHHKKALPQLVGTVSKWHFPPKTSACRGHRQVLSKCSDMIKNESHMKISMRQWQGNRSVVNSWML